MLKTINKKDYMKDLLEQESHYKKLLFCRGYIITSKKIENLSTYPFYNNWRQVENGGDLNKLNLQIYVHKWMTSYTCKQNDLSITMIGHAYDPYKMKHQEDDILDDCIRSYRQGKDALFDRISELTGIHLILVQNKDEVIVVQDCCGLMPVYYGKIDDEIYMASHGQLVADISGLNMSEKIQKYIDASFYKIGIAQICGIDTPFEELTMLSPNTYLSLQELGLKRFYPKAPIKEADSDTLLRIERLLKNSMCLCAKKWHCSISLSGGIDSKMTLAAANGIYDNFYYFSFASTEAERRDAVAANKICSNLGLKHVIYEIPNEEIEIENFDVIADIMDHNQAYIRKRTGSDARKRAYLSKNANIDIEIKSHVSEVGRAFYHKKLGKGSFKYPLTPRNMSNLAKRNFFNRRILKQMDGSYSRFIISTGFGQFPEGYDETDMFYWENRMPAWGALVKQSFDVAYDTTIIYNNRKLLEKYLSFPIEERIADKPQKAIIDNLNRNLFNMDISSDNAMKSKKRVILENLFFRINNKF